MKKILLTMAVALSGLTASAQWVKPTVDRTCDVVAGDTLYLYNTGAKMFLNQGNSYGTQASLADEGLMVRVNQYVAGEDAAWDGKTYTIEDFRPVQNSWFYVFIASDTEGLESYGGCYMDKANQEDYMWEFEKLDNGSYHIRPAEVNPVYNCKTYNRHFLGSVLVEGEIDTHVYPLIDVENVMAAYQYYTEWAFVPKDVYAEYAAKHVVYEAAMTLKAYIDDCSARGLDATVLQQVYDNTSATLEELQEAQTIAKAMISQDDEQKVTPDNPKDFSSYIENPDFATSTTGWTKEGTAKTFEVNGWVPATVTDVMMAPALNLWGNNQNIHVSQIVENLPNGIYKMTAGVYSQANGPYIEANDARAAVTTGGPTMYEVLTYVSDNTLNIAIGFPAEGTQWVMADCFRLKYFGNGFEAYKMWIEETLSKAENYDNMACNKALYEEYRTMLDAMLAATTQEEIAARLPQFITLYDSLKANVAAYAEYVAQVADAQNMVIEGAYAGEAFDLLCDYIGTDYEPDDVFPNGSAEYILNQGLLATEEIIGEQDFLKQLIQNTIDNCMAVGADATAKIVNPNFDSGFTGWNYDNKLGTPSPGGMPENPNVERWNQNFDFYQDVELPNGVYRLDAQAFYRTASNTVAVNEWTEGTSEVMTELYANNGSVLLKNIYEQAQESGFYKEDNAFVMDDGQVVPNSMKTASEAFTAGLYENSVKGVVWNGKLRVGIRSLNAEATDRWSIWDNFRLTFLGYEAEAIEACHKQTVAEAEALANGELTDEQLGALAEAIAAPVDYADARGTLDVIARIRAAMDVANDYLTGIDATPATRKEAVPVAVYNLNGVRTDGLQRGINLVRMSDNTVKKVLVK